MFVFFGHKIVIFKFFWVFFDILHDLIGLLNYFAQLKYWCFIVNGRDKLILQNVDLCRQPLQAILC